MLNIMYVDMCLCDIEYVCVYRCYYADALFKATHITISRI